MPSITTNSGGRFDVARPRQKDYNINDIAHALSNLCRFAGHAEDFYSVAEHSVHCAHILGRKMKQPREIQLAGLLHDLAEAYCVDVPTPLKSLLPEYTKIETRVQEVGFKALGLPLRIPEAVWEADLKMLATEAKFLFPNVRRRISPYNAIRGYTLHCWSPPRAKREFLRAYERLTKG